MRLTRICAQGTNQISRHPEISSQCASARLCAQSEIVINRGWLIGHWTARWERQLSYKRTPGRWRLDVTYDCSSLICRKILDHRLLYDRMLWIRQGQNRPMTMFSGLSVCFISHLRPRVPAAPAWAGRPSPKWANSKRILKSQQHHETGNLLYSDWRQSCSLLSIIRAKHHQRYRQDSLWIFAKWLPSNS
jgi:hypothetical protein